MDSDFNSRSAVAGNNDRIGGLIQFEVQLGAAGARGRAR